MALTTIGTVARKLRSFLANHSEAAASVLMVERPDNSLAIAQADANGNAKVSVESSGLPTGAATSALQTALNALVTILNGLATTPTIPTQITASDDTDVSSVTAKGLIVETAGDLAVRGTGAPSTTVTITVAAGQYVPLQCSRVMAASTATVVGVS